MARRVVAAAVAIGVGAWWWRSGIVNSEPEPRIQNSGSASLFTTPSAPDPEASTPRATGQRAGRVLAELAQRAADERAVNEKREADQSAGYCEIRGRVVGSDGTPAGDGAV